MKAKKNIQRQKKWKKEERGENLVEDEEDMIT